MTGSMAAPAHFPADRLGHPAHPVGDPDPGSAQVGVALTALVDMDAAHLHPGQPLHLFDCQTALKRAPGSE